MIEKIIPRALDKSSDKKIVSNTSMIDALNLFLSEDNIDGEGNKGVLKNVKGNSPSEFAWPEDSPSFTTPYGTYGVASKAIGSVTDPTTQVCYIFMWSQHAENHGIWAYDKEGKLPHPWFPETQQKGSLRKVFESSQLNFPEHGFVKGNIVYKNSSEFYREDLRATDELDVEAILAHHEETGDAIIIYEKVLAPLYPRVVDYLDKTPNAKKEFSQDAILYFTDNENEPRKINVYRALMGISAAYSSTDSYDPISMADHICACPKTPLERIDFEFSPDSTKSVNNFSAVAGFQFAYQNIYTDGTESAISPYSKMAFPPSVVNRGAAQTDNLLNHNLCTLTIPRQGIEIASIRILARYGNTSNFFEVDEVSNKPLEAGSAAIWNPVSRKYKFYNDRVGAGVSPLEVDKTFDNVPRKAQAQTAIANRLVYGNYLEGYDNVKTDCTAEVVYNERPQDFLDLVIRAHPAIESNSNFGTNKCAAFQIDTTDIPPTVFEGTKIIVALDYTPDRNFHIYQANDTTQGTGNSYHQSRQIGKYSSNAVGYRHWPLIEDHNYFFEVGESDTVTTGFNETHDGTPADEQEKGFTQGDFDHVDAWKSPEETGEIYLRNHAEPFFGRNYGVGCLADENNADSNLGVLADLPRWRTTNDHDFATDAITSGPPGYGGWEYNGSRARYGTSAGNPLILNGASLRFEVKFSITEDLVGDAKEVIATTIAEALAGADGTSNGGGLFSFPDRIDIDVANDVINTVKIKKEDYDLGLGYGDDELSFSGSELTSDFSFKSFMPGDEYSYLINGVGALQYQDNDVTDAGSFLSHAETIPHGYFIINRAEVDFYLEQVGGEHFDGKHLRLAISRIDVDQEDLMTCIKKLDPRSPWWVVPPSFIKNPDFAASLSSYNTQGGENSDYTLWNTITDSNHPAYDLEELQAYQKSLAYKFRIPNPLFYEGPTVQMNYANPYGWFVGGFSSDASITGFQGSQDGGEYWVNLGFCGYMDIETSDQEIKGIYKPHNSNGSDYIPVLGQSKFKFSLMDGEGGPGGANAGTNSAYDKYGNSKYGSIAARVDFGYDGESVEVTRRNSTGTNGEFIYQAHVGGSYADGGSNQLGFTPKGTGNSGIASGLGLDETNFYGGGLWRETYVVSGPFFTGSIAMNPIIGENTDSANKIPFPPVKDYTTTLPLVWVNTAGLALSDGGHLKQNWLQTAYPWPQTIRKFGPTTDGSGFITNAQVDLTPFSQPLKWPNDWGEGDPQNLDISTIVDQHDSPSAQGFFGGVDFSLYHSHIEGKSQSSFISGGGGADSFSFKSSATHEFGIVYYDQRGRHGYVNHLDSIYVEGYSSQSRGNDKQGSAHIKLNLNHTPPSWAYNYKIAYSKNTSVSDFVQYSAGGAFVAEGATSDGDPSRIYVSLNYLQGHPISYSSAWGARSKEGGMAIYTPKDGDRLRVISYMLPPSALPVPERVYPQGFEFEVSGVVSLDNSEKNPLAYLHGAEVVVDENRQGLFIVLKNNNSANGFRYQDVRDALDNWGNNCIIEIYSPVKELAPEDRLYYEIGDTYNVLRNVADVEGEYSEVFTHEEDEILLTEGDVYFRAAAVNMREYNDGSDADGTLIGYEDIIINTLADDSSTLDTNEFEASEANFKSYYIESPVATDLFKSDSISVGRPNIIKHDAKESYKKSSVIHSDRDIKDSSKVSYSSFNRSIPITENLDVKGGEINYLANKGENCIFVQRDKCGYIPIDRNIISDVEGKSNLIASSKFLNTPKYYSGDAGCDNNPESVVNVDNDIYFAHKTKGEVYRVSGANGINVISENNMKSYFKNLFQSAIDKSTLMGSDVRVVGGYDPLKQEYLLTVLDPGGMGDSESLGYTLPVFPRQLTTNQQHQINFFPWLVYGCTDLLSPTSDVFSAYIYSDQSCQYQLGCTFPPSDNYDPTATVSTYDCVVPSPYPFNACDYNGTVPAELAGITHEADHPNAGMMYPVGGSISELTGYGMLENYSIHNPITKIGNASYIYNCYFYAIFYKQYISYTTAITGHKYDEALHKRLFPRVGLKDHPSLGRVWYMIPDDEVYSEDESGNPLTYNGWNTNGKQYTNHNQLMAYAWAAEIPAYDGIWFSSSGASCRGEVPEEGGYYYIAPDWPNEEDDSDGENDFTGGGGDESDGGGGDDFPPMTGGGTPSGGYGGDWGGLPPPNSPPPFPNRRVQTSALPFTGSLCDYPILLNAEGHITALSIVAAFNNVKDLVFANDGAGTFPYNNDGASGLISLTHHFPNFAGGPAGQANIDWFYDMQPLAAGSVFPSMNWIENKGKWFSASDEWSALAQLHPEWYTINENGIPEGGPTPEGGYQFIHIPCLTGSQPIQEYTGSLCDYPILINEMGMVTLDSVTEAYGDVMGMIIGGEITMAEATFVFPDLNNDGVIQIQDLIEMLILQPNLGCGKGKYTGNPCDYGLISENGVITRESATKASTMILNDINLGNLKPEEAILLFPDVDNKGFISQYDTLKFIDSLPEGGIKCPSNPLRKISTKEKLKGIKTGYGPNPPISRLDKNPSSLKKNKY